MWTGYDWQPAPPSTAKQVQGVVQAEISALGSGSVPMAYGSQTRRQRFPDPAQYLRFVQERNPALLEHLPFDFGPVGIDQSKQNAWAVVFLKNRGGGRTRADFLLVREGKLFKIHRIRSQTQPN